MAKKKKKLLRERAELKQLLDEMLEILDATPTAWPSPPEDFEPPPLRFILDLRALYSKATGKQPTHVNVDPETEAAILMSRGGMRLPPLNRIMAWTTPRTWTPGETVTASIMNTHVRDKGVTGGILHIYGMQWHCLEPGRLPWEMWHDA